MRLYIDGDSVDFSLIRPLRRDERDVQIPEDVGLPGRSDQAQLANAIRDRRAMLTRNSDDLEDLHDLVTFAANGLHGGISVVLVDANPRNNMTPGDIARAVRNRENAGIAVGDSCHELNHWQ